MVPPVSSPCLLPPVLRLLAIVGYLDPQPAAVKRSVIETSDSSQGHTLVFQLREETSSCQHHHPPAWPSPPGSRTVPWCWYSWAPRSPWRPSRCRGADSCGPGCPGTDAASSFPGYSLYSSSSTLSCPCSCSCSFTFPLAWTQYSQIVSWVLCHSAKWCVYFRVYEKKFTQRQPYLVYKGKIMNLTMQQKWTILKSTFWPEK